jgi:hypothetical protein
MTKYFKYIKLTVVLLLSILITILGITLFNKEPIYAANVLTNPSFTGGTTGWTLSGATYSSTTYQDSAGSVHGYAARKASTTSIATQSSYFSNLAGNIITLSAWHTITIGGNGNSIIYIEREEQSSPGTWVELWNSGTIYGAYGWTQLSNLDVSSSFGTGSYRIRIRMELNGGASAGSGINAYVDNLNLDVIPQNIIVGSTGTQVLQVQEGTQNVHIGGAFTLQRETGSTTVTSITISNTGTIADSNLTDVRLYYKQEGTCSSTIPIDASLFNSTGGTFSSGSSTVTGSMTIGTSQTCVYVRMDVGTGANVDDTIEIQITNPSTQVVASAGTVTPSSAVTISGSTTIIVQVIDVAISIETDGTVDYGILPATESKSTIDLTDTQTIRNTGNVDIDLDIKSSNAIGGVDWTLGSNYGSDIFVHEYSNNSGSVWNKFLVANQYYTLTSSALTPDSTLDVDLRITVPSLTTDYQEKSITLTILATESI